MNTHGFVSQRSLANSGARASGRRASVATSGFMIAALLGLAVLRPAAVFAATAEGTLITNIATATFRAVDSTPFAATYNVTALVFVVAPSVQVQKRSTPSIECSGGTVTFCMYAYNNSLWTSAFNVTLNDRLPGGVAYVAGQNLWAGLSTGATVTQGWGGEGLPTNYYTWGSEPAAGVLSSGNYYYLRWVINLIGPGKSAMICYRVQLL